HARDGVTAVPPFDTGEGFLPAGAVRATPADLLSYLEAHLRPHAGPHADRLRTALLAVQRPLLDRGIRHRHTHTLAWVRHPSPYGPLYFHSGATTGQEAFLAFQPDTGRALVALATRRYSARTTLTQAAYGLLTELP
ncbi:serine hydrolase, partial [Streptomyces oceani]